MIALVLLLAAASSLNSAPASMPKFSLAAKDGTLIPIVDEDTGGIKDRPLVKSQERWKAKFGHDFLYLEKIQVKAGLAVTGNYTVSGGPLRLTVYELSKDTGADHRMLKVLATKWLKDGETAHFETTVVARDEDVFLISAEKTASADELDPHLKYMASQGDQLVVNGFGTNWNLTQLKFKMAEKADPKADFTHDADWLVDHMIDPQWVLSIRLTGAGDKAGTPDK